MRFQPKLPKEIKPKEYRMTEEEQNTLIGETNMRSQHALIISLLERDMFIYVNKDIRERLKLPKDVQMTYDVASGKILVHPKTEPNSKN